MAAAVTLTISVPVRFTGLSNVPNCGVPYACKTAASIEKTSFKLVSWCDYDKEAGLFARTLKAWPYPLHPAGELRQPAPLSCGKGKQAHSLAFVEDGFSVGTSARASAAWGAVPASGVVSRYLIS